MKRTSRTAQFIKTLHIETVIQLLSNVILEITFSCVLDIFVNQVIWEKETLSEGGTDFDTRLS